MTTSEAPLGSSALLRVAGLPIRYWLSAANPDLFESVRMLERYEEVRRTRSSRLADRIGQHLVPHSGLARHDRALLLALRRRLHGGQFVDLSQYQQAIRIVTALDDAEPTLVTDLADASTMDSAAQALAAELSDAIVAEEARLAGLRQMVLDDSPLSRAILPGGADMPSWSAGRRNREHRRQLDQAWRHLSRATTDSTPRDWLSHVALVPVDTVAGSGAARSAFTAAVTARFDARWMENVRSRRRILSDPPTTWPEPDTSLALAPLHWFDGDHLVVVVLDQHQESAQVTVRRTPLLAAICTALEAGPRTFDAIVAMLGSVDRHTLRGFVRHLVMLGVLWPGGAPRAQLARRAQPGRAFPDPIQIGDEHAGWVDVYRSAETALPAGTCADLQDCVSLTLRLLSLMRADSNPAEHPLVPDDGRTWRVTDILRAHLAKDESDPPHRHGAPGWRPPASKVSGYGHLVRELVTRMDGSGVLDIDEALLDRLGAPDGAWAWPMDCLLRMPAPGAGFAAVLAQLWPPGTMDARFAETLHGLYGPVPHVEAYRAFLRRLEELTGTLLVELLAPPLSDGAANAVRRPVYTGAWTGDPHTAAYLPSDADPGRYIPLRAIRVRRVDGKLHADVGGQPIWPVYHATRSFSAPWDRIGHVLLATAPRIPQWAYRHLGDSLALFPDRLAVPRITVNNRLVLSAAQWRLPADALWDRDSPLPSKIRALVRLRDRLRLPRWVHLSSPTGGTPVPCDLDSLLAIRAVERLLHCGPTLHVEEMLPTPEQLLVADRAHRDGDRLASELMLRFPCDETPTAMADRIAPEIRAAVHGPARISARAPP